MELINDYSKLVVDIFITVLYPLGIWAVVYSVGIVVVFIFLMWHEDNLKKMWMVAIMSILWPLSLCLVVFMTVALMEANNERARKTTK